MQSLADFTQRLVSFGPTQYRALRDSRRRRVQDDAVPWDWSLWSRLHPSLQQGYKLCLGLVAAVWLLCLIFAIWVGVGHTVGEGFVVALQTGDCSTVSRSNFWIHLLINAVASSIYAVSSYVMQRLAAPTRLDVDNAHRDAAKLKIGSLALTNFSLLSKKKLIVFSLLWCSSLPLHLMFNSVVVYTSTNAEWSNYVTQLTEGQLESARANDSITHQVVERNYAGYTINGNLSQWYPADKDEFLQMVVHQQPAFTLLEQQKCIEAYSTGLSNKYGDLLIITEGGSTGPYLPLVSKYPNPSRYPLQGYDLPWAFLCDSLASVCDPETILQSAQWTLNGHVVSQCLAREMPEQCELNASLAIMIVVMVCITGKLIALVLAIALSRDQPLVTIGDAIASFLQEPVAFPDTDEPLQYDVAPTEHGLSQAMVVRRVIRPQKDRKRMVMRELSGAFWSPLLLAIILLSLAFGLFAYAYQQTQSAYELIKLQFSFRDMLALGFGNVPLLWTTSFSNTIMFYSDAQNPHTSYISGAVLANLPQLGLSALYLTHNNFITRLCTALEFRGYTLRRRGLRVSAPTKGTAQRESHFLSVPLRWSLLNIAVFVILHTVMSQTLFLHRVYALYPNSFTNPDDIGRYLVSMIGFSPLSSFVLSLLLSLLVMMIIVIGCWTVDWRFPDTTGSSWKLATTCNPPKGSMNTHEQEVRWGVTQKHKEDGSVQCSFSSLAVRPPVKGEPVVVYTSRKMVEKPGMYNRPMLKPDVEANVAETSEAN